MKSHLRAISIVISFVFPNVAWCPQNMGFKRKRTLTQGMMSLTAVSQKYAQLAMDRKGMEHVMCTTFLFRGAVPAASAEFHGETLPGVRWLWWEQAQLHSNLQWIRESLGCLLFCDLTPTSALRKDLCESDSASPRLYVTSLQYVKDLTAQSGQRV